MAPSPSSHFLCNSNSSLHLITLPHQPIYSLRSPKPFSLNFIRRKASRVPPSCDLHRPFANASDFSGSVHLGVSKMKFWQMGSDYFQIQAASDGGVGGNDGFGGSDGGSSDGRSEEGGGSGSQSFLSWYLMALEKHPVLTKAITSAFLTLIGDLVCQLLIDRVAVLDLKRTFVFSFLGFALVGPTLHFWYFSLSNLVTLPGASGTILRLLLDQFLFSPFFIGVFLSALVTLEGRPSQVVPKLRQEWFSSVLANWQLWIPFQFLNFQFVPQQFQVLAANIIALVWNVILSFKAHKEILPK